ncbi:hypothetical protein ACFE04_016526 [Oxalis oulophora]
MAKSNATAIAAAEAATPPHDGISSPENSVKSTDKKKKSIFPKLFSLKKNRSKGSLVDDDDNDNDNYDDISREDIDSTSYYGKKIAPRNDLFTQSAPPPHAIRKNLSDRETSSGIKGLNLSNFDDSMASSKTHIQDYRIFVSTWNVGGKTPEDGLDLKDFLLVEGSADIYVCGFQEIVPLSAGNIFVIEDNHSAAKWLGLINQALNKPHHDPSSGTRHSSRAINTTNSKESKQSSSTHFFHKPSLKLLSMNYRADSSILKTCNCSMESPARHRWRNRKTAGNLTSKSNGFFRPPQDDSIVGDLFTMDDFPSSPSSTNPINYRMVASKQMVGLFLSVWARKELVPYIAHLRLTSVGRGIMGCLGNKGCIAISMSLHQTRFCFVCSHLASGEKEGDELKRNADVADILKSTHFQNICKNQNRMAPEKIMDHDRIFWLGDLNYRVALSYNKARALLEENDWDTLLENDQLNIERKARRVFCGFQEGKIIFAPTYKYSLNSDSYAGETVKSKKNRRTPAWCDRILWHGEGIDQLSYIRGESRFSDHRPVCAVFQVEIEVTKSRNNRLKKGHSCAGPRLEYEDPIQRLSFCDY